MNLTFFYLETTYSKCCRFGLSRLNFCFPKHISEYDRLYHALLGKKGSPWFVQKMRASLISLVKEYQQIPQRMPTTTPYMYPASDNELIPDLIATMIMEAITWWLENEKPYPPRRLPTVVFFW